MEDAFPLTRLMTVGMEAAGVLTIGASSVLSLLIAVRGARRASGWSGAYGLYRASFGRGILLGLEFLVAADIIRTVAVTPTVQSVTVLALIILIRTFLSISLKAEIEGAWPWQRIQPQSQQQPQPTSPEDSPSCSGPDGSPSCSPVGNGHQRR
ncbi:DUF1622 domain-containing protein [Methylobacterium aquaticum]|jgi:uncharacterized membrane protein|uniref:DUF1622 domain-containing protein n=1 Tax=Methylobacterium aquaticum TaxID=270351 RepID=UPI0009E57376|nr:DUF1622 domain-containing protein [Methylobacterium aquaticum]